MAVRAPEFSLYVDVRLQRLAVNIAQPDLQVIEVGEDVRPGLNLVTRYTKTTDKTLLSEAFRSPALTTT